MAKILVVDDEQKIREVIRKYAEVSGHEVTEAGDGMSAVGLCKLNDFDLIIMDIMMPKLDGFSACREIRKEKNAPINKVYETEYVGNPVSKKMATFKINTKKTQTI